MPVVKYFSSTCTILLLLIFCVSRSQAQDPVLVLNIRIFINLTTATGRAYKAGNDPTQANPGSQTLRKPKSSNPFLRPNPWAKERVWG